MYNDKSALQRISEWDIKDAHNLVEYIGKLWEYEDYFKVSWGVDRIHHKNPVMLLELHTGGWSGNEEIIEALQDNRLFWLMWWSKTERGGHYYFEIDFSQIGFTPVADFKVRENTYAQYIYKMKKNYDWVVMSHRKRLIRKKVK